MLRVMSLMPSLPEAATKYKGESPLALRYEDVCSDGRLLTIAMPTGIGTLWRSTVEALPLLALRDSGTVPILAQLWMEGSEEAIDLAKPARCVGSAMLAHTRDDAGEVNRLLLDMSVSLYGTSGRMFGPAPARAGEEVLAGKVYARHVFSRPFAPRKDRRVREFDCEGMPRLPETQMPWAELEDFQAAPEGADALEESWREDPAHIRYAFHHCDSNQHVNSLVYPRQFEDVCQRRFAELDAPKNTLSRQVAISYRKPFFAGQQGAVRLQSFRKDNELMATGGFYTAGDTDGRPHSVVRMRFR